MSVSTESKIKLQGTKQTENYVYGYGGDGLEQTELKP
jgi:hypothetical protein